MQQRGCYIGRGIDKSMRSIVWNQPQAVGLMEAVNDLGAIFDELDFGHLCDAGFYIAICLNEFRTEAAEVFELVNSSVKLL